MFSNKKNVQILTQILIKNNIKHAIISPGSRNIPIIIDFKKNKFIIYKIVDERCAGFFALGASQALKKPVILNCTSGSAIVNYYPAITEAYYQNIPLIIITADRPKEDIGISDNQTIKQKNIFYKHTIKSISIDEIKSNNEALYTQRIINECINKSLLIKKPIHINVHLSEPLNKTVVHKIKKIKKIFVPKIEKKIQENRFFKKIKKLWYNTKKKMILIGQNKYHHHLNKYLIKMNKEDQNLIILIESTSNIYHKKFINNIDRIITNITHETWLKIKPEILITIGNNIISKNIKILFRKYSLKQHWHLSEIDNEEHDTYYKTTILWNIHPLCFLKKINNKNIYYKNNYKNKWLKIKTYKNKKHDIFIKNNIFSDLKALSIIIKNIPVKNIIHLGNSTIIRYYEILYEKKMKIFCNRGTSGIEGSVSTAIGYSSFCKNKEVNLIIGDLSFFYDSNALWNEHVPNNFKIILINNGRGSIFKIINNKNCFFNKEILSKHNLTAKYLCKMFNWNYSYVKNIIELKLNMKNFWNQSNKPSLLEIDTKKTPNEKILKKYYNYIS